MERQTAICTYVRYKGPVIRAKREIPYELQVSSRLILDELCFNGNKFRLETAINEALDNGDRALFNKLSAQYLPFIQE